MARNLAHSAIEGPSAPATLSADERGVVFVEFLAAFLPVFLIFLGVCQLALITIAKLSVGAAASAAARSAIVMLEAPPPDLGGAPRGDLEAGHGDANQRLSAWLKEAGAEGGTGTTARPAGARRAAIEAAALFPLLSLARAKKEGANSRRSLGNSLGLGPLSDADHAIASTSASTAITISSNRSARASDPVITQDALVTVRVTYLFECVVPLVSRIVCDDYAELQEKSESPSEDDPNALRALHFFSHADPTQLASDLRSEGRFMLLEAQMTLPNQGAAYVNEIDDVDDEVEDP